MKKIVLLLSTILFLPSCFATFTELQNGLDKHQGLSLNTLIDRIGFPTAQQNIAGRKLYVWDTSNTVTMSMPTTSNTSGTVTSGTSSGTYSGSSTIWVPTTYNYNCRITIEVDDQDKIISNYWEGNRGGCERYAKALQ
tara:strand:+ start:136 stop:549 length:414 start_codon:yes stop_codon:yes gene_type:complete